MIMTAYGEMLAFLTSGPSLEAIVAYCPSRCALERVDYLTRKWEANQITSLEQRELDEFFRIENFLYKLKLRAVNRLASPALVH